MHQWVKVQLVREVKGIGQAEEARSPTILCKGGDGENESVETRQVLERQA